MKLSYHDLFHKILTILNYKDCENFVEEIEQENHWEAIANCIKRLPEQAKEDIAAHPYNKEVFEKYITTDVYTEEVNNVSAKVLSDFLQHMTPLLNDQQKEQIAAVFPK